MEGKISNRCCTDIPSFKGV